MRIPALAAAITLTITACSGSRGASRADSLARATAHTGVEICDGIDNDGDGQVDEDLVRLSWRDADGDGFGDPEHPVEACGPSPHLAANANDCNDADPTVHPGAPEECNGTDDDCDSRVDEHAGQAWFVDRDGDGHGASDTLVLACAAPPGMVASDGDCNDGAAAIHPEAVELCDGIDNDCDGLTDDHDLDTVGQSSWSTADRSRSIAACTPPAGFTSDALEAPPLAAAPTSPSVRTSWGTD